MDDEPERTTIINVKSVNARAWERGKAAANRSGETMGNWLSRAVDQLANLESGERYILPGKPEAKPPAETVPAIDLREVAAVLVAMKEAGLPVQKRVGHQVNALLHAKLRLGRDEPTDAANPRLIRPALTVKPADPINGKVVPSVSS